MNALDAARVAGLAERLQLTPSQLLALAGRIAAQPEQPLDPLRLAAELARVRAAPQASAEAAARVTLGYAAFALADIDHALALAWSDAPTLER